MYHHVKKLIHHVKKQNKPFPPPFRFPAQSVCQRNAHVILFAVVSVVNKKMETIPVSVNIVVLRTAASVLATSKLQYFGKSN